MAKPWSEPDQLTIQTEEAKRRYIDSLDPEISREKWQAVVDAVALEFKQQLEVVFQTGQLPKAIEDSGKITSLLRQLTAPPLSQDQFKLLCPAWPKGSEKSGKRVDARKAASIAKAIESWLDPRILEGIKEGRSTEVAAGPLYILARQRFETDRRTEASQAQEARVISLLKNEGYQPTESREIDQPWTVGEGNFMHCTKFSSTAESTAEVDLAVGLPKGRLLAIECKVTNDATNSIKRINDVMKKREAWAKGYGNVLTTGAVLQGVIAPKDVKRLAASGVCVFFSHKLETLEQFLKEQN